MSGARFRLEDLSPAARAQALALLGQSPAGQTLASPPPAASSASGKKRLRQSRGLNKTETAFLAYLQAAYPEPRCKVYSQAIRVKLANGSYYKADFMTVSKEDGIRLWETKGFMREAAALRVKSAATLYPCFTVILVTKRKGGGWDFETVKP